jgi:protein involved in polysaccharide export with SLBB domain
VDISEFNLNGDMTQNPLLAGGDIVYVPRIDLQGAFVIIEGNVGSQGIYQTRRQETLFDFLTRLKAINRQSDVENIVLLRNDSLTIYNLLEKESEARRLILETGDRIRIPTHRNQVYVRGEVFRPGPYPFLANYMAQDYAGYAGLLETSKDLEHLYVIRAESGAIEHGREIIVENGDVVVVPRKQREAWKDILTIITPIVSIALSTIAIIQTSK